MIKRFLVLALVCALLVGGMTSAFATQAAPAGGDMDTQDGGRQVAEGEEEMAMSFRPAPFNMEPEAIEDYTYMGIKFELPPALREMILKHEVFMAQDGDIFYGSEEDMVSADFVIDVEQMYIQRGEVEFLFIPEDQREGMPSMALYEAGTFMDYDGYLVWKEGLYPLAKISMFHKDHLPGDIAEATGYPINEELGTYGDYTYYFSMNEAAEGSPDNAAEMLALVEALRANLQVTEPRKIDERFTHLTGTYTEDATAIGGFSTVDLDGNPITPDIFQNAKLTMVNVWTTWCSPCIQEMPDLAEIAKELGGEDFQLLGIVQDGAGKDGTIDEEKRELAKVICERTGVEYPVLLPDEVLHKDVLGGVLGFPTTYFVDSEGNVVGESVLGSQSKEDWLSIIEEMLALVQEAG